MAVRGGPAAFGVSKHASRYGDLSREQDHTVGESPLHGDAADQRVRELYRRARVKRHGTRDGIERLSGAAVSRQEEIGIRRRFSNNTLASVALFNLRQPSAATNSDNVYALDGNGRYRGLEFSLQGDLTRDVSVVATGMLLDARIVDSSDTSLVGKTPENTPHVTGSLFATYRVAQFAGLSFNGGMYYVGPRPVNDANQATIGGYTLFSAGARYETRLFGKHAIVQANLENATNKHYWSAAGSSQLAVGLERTLALTSTLEF
jgi:iron complex outermembrane receptor protein